jgi:hypothetical protein
VLLLKVLSCEVKLRDPVKVFSSSEISALQYTGDNLDVLLHFCNAHQIKYYEFFTKRVEIGYLLISPGDWVVRSSSVPLTKVSEAEFSSKYHTVNEK